MRTWHGHDKGCRSCRCCKRTQARPRGEAGKGYIRQAHRHIQLYGYARYGRRSAVAVLRFCVRRTRMSAKKKIIMFFFRGGNGKYRTGEPLRGRKKRLSHKIITRKTIMPNIIWTMCKMPGQLVSKTRGLYLWQHVQCRHRQYSGPCTTGLEGSHISA